MAADIVNLRRARKAKSRAAAEQLAEANRHRFGRTKAERTASDAQADLDRRRLDGHALARPPRDGEPTS